MPLKDHTEATTQNLAALQHRYWSSNPTLLLLDFYTSVPLFDVKQSEHTYIVLQICLLFLLLVLHSCVPSCPAKSHAWIECFWDPQSNSQRTWSFLIVVPRKSRPFLPQRTSGNSRCSNESAQTSRPSRQSRVGDVSQRSAVSGFLVFCIPCFRTVCTNPTKSLAKHDQVLQLGPVFLPNRSGIKLFGSTNLMRDLVSI